MINYKLNKIFNFLIIYYWGMLYIQAIPFFIDTPLLYLLYVVPIGLFIIYLLFYLVQTKDFNFDVKSYYLLSFAFLSILSAVFRFDFKSMVSVFLFSMGMIFIFKYKLFIYLSLLNKLFIISILLSIVCFYTHFSIYGFIPGQSTTTNSIELLAGRVSLFPNVAISIYFSFLVFLLNLFFNSNKSKYFYMLLSFYFIYFGVSRTLLILFLMIILFIFIKNLFSFKSVIFKIFPILGFIFVSIILTNFNEILNFLFRSDNLFIKNYFLHNADSVEELSSMNYRFMNWYAHLQIFMNYPWGISSNLLDSIFYDLTGLANGSESFLTSILAHYGFVTILFYLFIITILFEAFKKNTFYYYIFVYVFVFIGLLYGSFFNIYNVIYLILVSSLNLVYYNEESIKCIKNY